MSKKNVLNIKVKNYTDNETGEIIEVIETNKVIPERQGFMITYLSYIINLIDTIGNKKMQVVKYILENLDKHNNTLLTTNRELAKKINVSPVTVTETLRLLEESHIITRRTGAIMLNPKLIHRGSEDKEKILLTRFKEFREE